MEEHFHYHAVHGAFAQYHVGVESCVVHTVQCKLKECAFLEYDVIAAVIL